MLPSLLDYQRDKKQLPKWLPYSLAALLAFYHSCEKGDGFLIGHRDGTAYRICDDAEKLSKVAEWSVLPEKEYVLHFLRAKDFWGEDLSVIPAFYTAVLGHYQKLCKVGARKYIKALGELPV